MNSIEIKVPDIGGHENVDVIAGEVKVGDNIAIDQTLITLETDKATMDVPADAAGIVKAVHISVGDKVSEGSVIVTLEQANDVQEATSKSAQTETETATSTPNRLSGSHTRNRFRPYNSCCIVWFSGKRSRICASTRRT